MADVMAIVSKAVFEKAAGKRPALGTQLRMDRYVSANKQLEPLASGGKLYLVTVRPPDEALWLVAVLDKPTFKGKEWVAKACDTPITDISKLRAKIKFESGAGITAKKGALGMSLQTPRVLTAADCALLDAACGGPAAAVAPASARPAAERRVPAPPQAIEASSGVRKGLLIDAIVENPDSDEARRVYADQLTLKNDPRGEFILVDIALAGPLSIRKREQLQARRGELMAQHGKAWFKLPVQGRVTRGFVEAISGPIGKVLKAAPEIFEREPVYEVMVTNLEEGDVAKLLKAPWLARVRRLILRGELDEDSFASVCSSPATAQLTTLNVGGTKLEGAALAGLDGGLPHCRTLVLTGNRVGDDGMAEIVKWTHLGNLEALYATGCDLSPDGVDALLGGPQLPSLEKLTLSNNDLKDKGIGMIVANAHHVPVLRHLELRNTRMTKNGLQALLTAKLASVRRFDVRKNGIKADETPDPRVRAGK